ncbi:MAG: histidine kinase [Bacteroidetes bacterium]|nr:histidine kinase [Bacteroidota bacterium]
MNLGSKISTLVLSESRSARIGRHILFWSACWVFFGIIYGKYWRENGVFILNLKVSFVESFFLLSPHMFLTYSIIYFLIPKYLNRERYIGLFVGVLVCILLAAFISYAIGTTVVDRYRVWMGIEPVAHPLFYGLMAGLRGSLTVGGFAVAIKLLKMWYIKKQALEKLEREKLQAELAFLRGQLQPHFIFNTLNSIYSMALQKHNETPTAILRLSQLLRYSVSESEETHVPLERELNMLQDYVRLQQGRFGNQLQISLKIEGSTNEKIIAPLLLLPIIENAFKYGVDEVLQEGWISISIAVDQSVLSAKVINGISAQRPALHHLGIGHQNVRKRLELLYPKTHRLDMIEEDDLFIVNMQIDLDELIYTKNEAAMFVG